MGRRKAGEPKRVRKDFTLPPELVTQLEEHSAGSDVPESRIVERALRAYLPSPSLEQNTESHELLD